MEHRRFRALQYAVILMLSGSLLVLYGVFVPPDGLRVALVGVLLLALGVIILASR